jgi:hypothetical protein
MPRDDHHDGKMSIMLGGSLWAYRLGVVPSAMKHFFLFHPHPTNIFVYSLYTRSQATACLRARTSHVPKP